MTRRELEVKDIESILSILDKGKVIHLGLSDDNIPYVVPMNYGYTYENNKLTFFVHGAKDGYKYDVIRKNPNISFSIETDVKPFDGKVACQYGTSYSSVFGKGKATIIEDVTDKETALSVIMKTQTGKDFVFNDKLVSIVNIVKLDISEFTAKCRPMPQNA